MSEQAEAARVLEEAADLLLIHGRCTGQGQDGAGRLCVRGAIQKAQGERPTGMGLWPSPANDALERHLAGTEFAERHLERVRSHDLEPDALAQVERWESVFPSFIWNDSLKGEDQDFEVIDTLKQVAKQLRNGE